MKRDKKKIDLVLDTLERLHGPVQTKRRSAYDMLIYANCGYPASEDACQRGYAALARDVGTSIEQILAAKAAKLAKAMREGGMVPELRAKRLKEIALKLKHEPAASLRDRKLLKKLPTIGDPGADKILLFTRAEPIAAVPSNATQVPIRIGFGLQQKSYAATYRSAQAALDAVLPRTYEARVRAHLLLKRHGQEICKPARPRCELCPLTKSCDYFAG